MKHLFPILLMLSALLCSCGEKEDILPEQQTKFISYLTTTHVPKLVSEREKNAAQEKNLEYYTTAGDSTYRYIVDIYNVDREQKAQVEYGDSLSLTFRMYVFAFKDIVTKGDKIDMPYYTNDPLLELPMIDVGLTPGWVFEPLDIKLGTTPILKGLEIALPGCREGDVVELYMSYNMAYGSADFGLVPKKSPVAILFTVVKVKKN
ncbi:MAG: FKBP-type peptidyl-prolyl cis-trans isomerase [Alistipes sp.]